jgi:hypothetical protein
MKRLVPSLQIGIEGSACFAGPLVTAPVATSKVAPWHGHEALLPEIVTSQHACVQLDENAAYCPGPVVTT